MFLIHVHYAQGTLKFICLSDPVSSKWRIIKMSDRDNPRKMSNFAAMCMTFESRPSYFLITSSMKKALGLRQQQVPPCFSQSVHSRKNWQRWKWARDNPNKTVNFAATHTGSSVSQIISRLLSLRRVLELWQQRVHDNNGIVTRMPVVLIKVPSGWADSCSDV
jgi:hypothetical protein